MKNFIDILNQILKLETNDKYFIHLDELIIALQLPDATHNQLNLLFKCMNKLIFKRPINQTLLLINRIIHELNENEDERKKFILLYSVFLNQCQSEELKKEVEWFITHHNKNLDVHSTR